jgi:hypothetical protein
MLSSSKVLAAILAHVRSPVTEDVTYVSLNYDNPGLHSIMPWGGTRVRAGPESVPSR